MAPLDLTVFERHPAVRAQSLKSIGVAPRAAVLAAPFLPHQWQFAVFACFAGHYLQTPSLKAGQPCCRKPLTIKPDRHPAHRAPRSARCHCFLSLTQTHGTALIATAQPLRRGFHLVDIRKSGPQGMGHWSFIQRKHRYSVAPNHPCMTRQGAYKCLGSCKASSIDTHRGLILTWAMVISRTQTGT